MATISKFYMAGNTMLKKKLLGHSVYLHRWMWSTSDAAARCNGQRRLTGAARGRGGFGL